MKTESSCGFPGVLLVGLAADFCSVAEIDLERPVFCFVTFFRDFGLTGFTDFVEVPICRKVWHPNCGTR